MSQKASLIRWIIAAICLCYLSCYSLDVRIGMGDGAGVGLSYRTVGRGKPLIIIHDGPGLEKSLMYQGFDGLRSDMRVIYYDQRGCGRSEPLPPATSARIGDNIEDLEALRRYFHLERFSIAAHGWGAVIALEYARKYGKHVDSIMLITPISPFAPEGQLVSILDKLPPEARDSINAAVDRDAVSMLERREMIMRAVLPSLFHNKDVAKNIDFNSLVYSPDVNLRVSDELKSVDLFPVLSEITMPTLVVIGRYDMSTSVRDQMAYADGIATSNAIVFNESGHFPFLEECPFFTNVTKEFLLHRRIPSLVLYKGQS